MSSASRGLAPHEGLECLVDEDGMYGPRAEPRRGPQAGKSGDPHSQNADMPLFKILAYIDFGRGEFVLPPTVDEWGN